MNAYEIKLTTKERQLIRNALENDLEELRNGTPNGWADEEAAGELLMIVDKLPV